MPELITYDTIRKAHRAEKQEIALQKLPEDFFSLVRGWLGHKQSTQKGTASLLEIENAKKLLEDLVNRRQKKIVIAALHTIRGDVPPQNMALDEEKFFDVLVNSLLTFKRDAQEQMFGYDSVIEEKLESVKNLMDEMRTGNAESAPIVKEKENKGEIRKDESAIEAKPRNETEGNNSIGDSIPNMDAGKGVSSNPTENENQSITKLKITSDVPSFVDSEMKTHGPFKAGAVAELPNDIAQVLLARKAAEAL